MCLSTHHQKSKYAKHIFIPIKILLYPHINYTYRYHSCVLVKAKYKHMDQSYKKQLFGFRKTALIKYRESTRSH